MAYEIRITPEGVRNLDKLPTKVRDAALVALRGPISENLHRLGKPLVAEFDGLFSARRGDYRIIYSIDYVANVVIVHRIQHRLRLSAPFRSYWAPILDVPAELGRLGKTAPWSHQREPARRDLNPPVPSMAAPHTLATREVQLRALSEYVDPTRHWRAEHPCGGMRE